MGRDRLSPPGQRGRWLLSANEWILAIAILVVIAGTALLDANHTFWYRPEASAIEIARQTAYLGIFSLGAAVVIIAGGIDLSAGSMIAFSGTICATIMLLLAPEEMRLGQPVGLGVMGTAITATLIVGLLVGTLHTWLITVIGLPPFIATLATLVGLRSLSRAICENVTEVMWNAKATQIQIYDEQFRYLAKSVWIPIVLFLLLAAAIWFLLRCTVVGRHIYALGGNEQAARLSGIRTSQIKWLAYCIGTLTSTVAGILYIAEQSVASPQTLGRGYELNAIAAAVVGGCSLQGGVGTIPGTALGALFLRCVIDGVAKIIKTGADIYEGQIVGIVVVVAVAFSQLRSGAAHTRRLFPGALGSVSLISLALLAGLLGAMIGGTTAALVTGIGALLALGAVQLLQARDRAG